MKEISLPKLPDGDVVGVRISDDDKRMAFYLSGSRWPSNLYVCDVGGNKARRLTQNLSPKIDPENLVDGKVVRFKSKDGVEVPGILFQPLQAATSAKVPALVNVHGGPGGQSRLGYSPLVQYLVNHGYAVYSINNRGSSGYGKSFYKMDDRKHGEGDLDDCVASKAMLAETGWVDPARIGIMGGSYGGYMVLAALAFRPTEFACGVDIFGVANWLRTLQNVPSWWEAQRKAIYQEIGDPGTDADYLKQISPLFHAENIQRPLIVLQGKNDPRVLQVESDEMVAAVKKNNVPVEYIVFPDEGHGFRNKKNQQQGYEAILTFCDKHLAAPAQVGAR
jgi:dipeptidyl aminopeptidase/acylaminoacyl peptidase